MGNIIKKLDEFRSSNSFFLFGFLNSFFVICFSIKQLIYIDRFITNFYLVFFLLGGILSFWGFGEIILRRLNNEDYFLISSNNFLKIADFVFTQKTRKEVFEPIFADWQEEYFEALFKKEIGKARWVNVRYTYAFVAAMWMKSPIGDLIEFVIKIIKIAKP